MPLRPRGYAMTMLTIIIGCWLLASFVASLMFLRILWLKSQGRLPN
jgi:hypothetical protein